MIGIFQFLRGFAASRESSIESREAAKPRNIISGVSL